MTHPSPTSNTIISVPSYATTPGVGEYYPLQNDPTSTNLFSELILSGRAGIFVNPVANIISFTSRDANTLISVISDVTNHIGPSGKANLLSRLVSNSALIVFTEAPVVTSNIEVRYVGRGNVAFQDIFVADGAQTSFALSSDPLQAQIPSVYVNSVYQSNAAFDFTPKVYGLVEMLSELTDHTDRLSGLRVAILADDIDLQKVISVGTALNTLSNGLDANGSYSSNNVMYCMSSLFSADLLQSYRDKMTLLIPPITSNTANMEMTYNELDAMVAGVRNIIDSDVDFYRQVESQLAYSTLSSFVTSVYSEPSGKYLLKYLIGTDRLKEILGD
jgi:hypothetical protein